MSIAALNTGLVGWGCYLDKVHPSTAPPPPRRPLQPATQPEGFLWRHPPSHTAAVKGPSARNKMIGDHDGDGDDFECHFMMMMMLTQIRGFLSGHLSEVEHVAHHARFCQINFWRIVTLTIKSLSRKSHSHNTVILTHNAKNQHFFHWSVIPVALTAQRNGIKWALFSCFPFTQERTHTGPTFVNIASTNSVAVPLSSLWSPTSQMTTH